MEKAIGRERARSREMEQEEAELAADELRVILKRERSRMSRMAAEVAALKSASVQAQLQAEVMEEGRVNNLLCRLESLQQEKGRIIVELEREEEMLTNQLQKKLNQVRKKKELEEQIAREQQSHQRLQTRLSDVQDDGVEGAVISGSMAPLVEVGDEEENEDEEEEKDNP